MLNLKINHDIEIKQLVVEDAEALFDFVNRNRSHLKQWLNWVEEARTVDDEVQYLENLSKDVYTSKNLEFGIWYDNKIIGNICLLNIDRANKLGSLGYSLDEAYQNKGIMTQCVKAIIDFAFKELNLHRIELKILKENLKSKAIGQRLDFRLEGVSKESYYLDGKFLDCEHFSKLSTDI